MYDVYDTKEKCLTYKPRDDADQKQTSKVFLLISRPCCSMPLMFAEPWFYFCILLDDVANHHTEAPKRFQERSVFILSSLTLLAIPLS
jgi:hypothetical protein